MICDTLQGGAANAATGLLEGLLADSHPIERWHFSPAEQQITPADVSLDPENKRPPLERIIKNVNRELADRMRRKRHLHDFEARMKADPPGLINLHNIHTSGLDHASLQAIPKGIPIVWTMHDCWSFTTHAFKWFNPRLNETEFVKPARPENVMAEVRRTFFSDHPDTVMVGPSTWMTECAREVLGEGIRVEHIPYGVSTGLFQPLPQAECREQLGLDPRRVWLGFSSTWASTRKGTDIFRDALAQLDVSQLGVLCWGEKPTHPWPRGLEVRLRGSIGPEEISRHYSACDLFVCPSRADNLPNSVLESLACGVPVIGSERGGVPDMARPGTTGWLFDPDSDTACADAIRKALKDRANWPAMAKAGRQIATEEFSIARQASSYRNLFAELRSRRPSL